MSANEPTPWMGIEERINIYATMLWGTVLAIGLLSAQGETGLRWLSVFHEMFNSY